MCETSSPQDKRKAIIEAARRIFGRDGFDRAKVEQIALEAKVGKGTVYEYFQSKQDLFDQMVTSSISCYEQIVVRSLNEKYTAVSKLRAFIETHLEFITRHADMAQILMNDPGPVSKNLKRQVLKTRGSIIDVIERLIKEAQSNGEFRSVDPHIASLVFTASCWAIFGNALLLGTSISPDSIDSVLHIFLEGIKATN